MSNTVSIYVLHGRILRDTFPKPVSDSDGLLLFSIFHSYQIVLSGPVLSDRPLDGGAFISADTQRGCAAAVAELYSDHRAEPMYWYRLWNEWGSYSTVDSLTDDERMRMRNLMRQMQTHPFVSGFAYEDAGYDPAGYFDEVVS